MATGPCLGVRDSELDVVLEFLDHDTISAHSRDVAMRIADAASEGRLVIVGSALLPQKCFRGLAAEFAPPVAFIEYDARFWGRSIEGAPVLSPDAAMARFGPETVCIVGIWSPNHCYAETRDWLESFGFTSVFPVHAVFWAIPETMGQHYQLAPPQVFADRSRDAMRILDSLADDVSRTYFAGNLRWRVTLDPATMPDGDRRRAYFDPRLFDLGEAPVVVDVGAFDGDSLKSYLLWYGERLGRFVALEPDPQSFARLETFVASLPGSVGSKITTLPLAAGDTACVLRMAATGKPGSGGDNPADLIDVRCIRLDEELAGIERIDYLKFDIEGAEAEALEGAWSLIERHRPVVGIAAYHKPTDILDIPLAFIARFPDWRFHFRAHDRDGIDFVFYAVPPGKSLT